MTDPEEPKDMVTVVSELKEAVGKLALAAGQGWPLDKRETFAAFVLMGLASRLQPLHLTDVGAQGRLATLAVDLADLTIAEAAKEK